MTCDVTRTNNGVIFICSRNSEIKKCSICKSRKATKFCDFPLNGKLKGKTCSKPLCDKCKITVDNVADVTDELSVKAEIYKLLIKDQYGKPTREKYRTERPFGGFEPDTFDLCPAHARAMGIK